MPRCFNRLVFGVCSLILAPSRGDALHVPRSKMLLNMTLNDLCNKINIDFSITILVVGDPRVGDQEPAVVMEKFDADFIA